MGRQFLGWDEMPIERAATWLTEHFGPDMDGVLIALPGARSGRILLEKLARKIGPQLRPPDITTAGMASDKLLDVEGTTASRLVRTLAWKQALVSLANDDARALSRIVARVPLADDQAAWMSLAEEVRGLFGEIAAEGLQFTDVASNTMVATVEGEQQRWQALAAAQGRMVALVEDAGFVDPHLGRLRSIEAGRTQAVCDVVLIGVSEMNELLRRALVLCEQGDTKITALVFAPEAHADAFDTYGALIPEAWVDRDTSVDAASQWFVVNGPDAQAEQAARVIQSWNGAHAAEDISIGLANREVAPYMRAVMSEGGAVARDAAGTQLGRTRPAVLLDAVARFVESRRYSDFATLVRHPDFEAALRQAEPSLEPVTMVDRYHEDHLPSRVDGRWLADPDDSHDKARAAQMNHLWKTIGTVLGGFLDQGRQPGDPVRQLLQDVYGSRDLDPSVEADRILIHSLSRLGEVLTELDDLPATLVPGSSPTARISLVLRAISSAEVPPAAAQAGDPTLEMLGWLELALDNAPALVVTGFEERRVPESVIGDAYLPNRLRQSLGLVDNQQRLARDLYATELLLHSREEVAFITGRRSAAGDPQLPSRIVFHCAEADVVFRAKRFLNGSDQVSQHTPATVRAGHDYALPRLDREIEVASMSVTAFASYLASPYLFYLERVARLKSLDDRARELDPMSFGSLAHRVLQRFGENPDARNECDSTKIAQILMDELHTLGTERYGQHPLPAVRLQLEQLSHRLRLFADVQANQRAAGWEIRATEWSPDGGSVEFVVDDIPLRLRGQIDRIDYHAGKKQWAIWDYKTGESVEPPVKVHRRPNGEWLNLQLPLYCVLAAELLDDDNDPKVGYIALPREEGKIRFEAITRWSRRKDDTESFGEGVESAIEAAHDVIRKIRRGEFFTDEGFEPRDPIFAAIGGVGIIATGEEAE